jgi:hypothetical protein
MIDTSNSYAIEKIQIIGDTCPKYQKLLYASDFLGVIAINLILLVSAHHL